MENNRFIFSVLVILSLVFFLSLSSVSAASHDLTDDNTTEQFQDIINTDPDNELVINLASGTYDGFTQINVNRSAIIRGQGADTVITGTGTLFNVTAPNVTIINLTIKGYDTAILSNATNLTIKSNNIETTSSSISLISKGASNPITGVRIEDNIILSHANSNYGAGAIYLSGPQTDKAVFDVLFKGNNITADTSSYGNGVFLGNSTSSVVSSANLVFENNNITAIYYGVGLCVQNSNNTNITFTNNTIKGSNNFIYAQTSNNTNITFTNNNMTGTSTTGRGIRIDAYSSTNVTIIVANNNIEGGNYALDIATYTSKNVNITVDNNNITGTRGGTGTNYAVYMRIFDSDNVNTTIVNNNIKAEGTYNQLGLDINLGSGSTSLSNTNLTIANNNITSSSKGLNIYTNGIVNTTITVTKNNITATAAKTSSATSSGGRGVYFRGDRSDKSNIIFSENNIFGERHGVWVYSSPNSPYTPDDDVKDVLFLNNNITATIGDAFYFQSPSSRATDISNFVIKGNNIIALNGTALNFTEWASTSTSVNITMGYNRILSLNGVNITKFSDDGSSFDYNWWGKNDITNKIVGINTNNHYILNITNGTSLDDVKVGNVLNFALLVLNTTKINEGVEKLPYFVINGTFNGIKYNTNRDNLFLHNFIIMDELLQTVTAKLDDEEVVLTFNATRVDTNISIVPPVDAKVGKTTVITGYLTDGDANLIVGADLEVIINGESFVVKTDSNGRWNVSYKPNSAGIVNVLATYNGTDNYLNSSASSSFNVSKGNFIVDIDVKKNGDGSVDIEVSVTDEDGDPVGWHEVEINLNGKIVGTVITNKNGKAYFHIPADKLINGENTVTATVNGDDSFNAAIKSISFVIDKKNETDNSVVSAVMKKTGMPITSLIAILLVFVSLLGVNLRRKD